MIRFLILLFIYFNSVDIQLHVCSWFSSRLGQHAFYVNATKIGIRNDPNADILEGGGTLLLGQKLDQDGFEFNLTTSFQ